MYPDFKELSSIFNERRIKYLSLALTPSGVYAQPRATKGLNILVKADTENSKAVFASLAK